MKSEPRATYDKRATRLLRGCVCLALFLLTLGLCASALASSVFSHYPIVLPEDNLRLVLPVGWYGESLETGMDDGVRVSEFSLDGEDAQRESFFLVCIPKEFKEGVSSSFRMFLTLADMLFDGESFPGVEILEWKTQDRMRAVEVMSQDLGQMLIIGDTDRYLFAVYASEHASDKAYTAGVRDICQSLALIDNPHPPVPAPEADFTTTDWGDGVAITGYLGEDLVLDIPAALGGKPVCALASQAFYESTVQRLSLPGGIESIGAATFSGCNNLWGIDLPASLRQLEGSAFESCYMLDTITLPEGLETIGEGAFWGCMSLREITLPKSLRTLGNMVFGITPELTRIALAKGSETFAIQDGILYTADLKTLVLYPNYLRAEALTIPDGVEGLADGALAFNGSLRTLTLPDTLTTIGKRALLTLPNLESITIPPSVTSLDESGLQLSETATLYGVPGSAAETFANAMGFAFAPMAE